MWKTITVDQQMTLSLAHIILVDYPNFSYRSNALLVPQTNFRPPSVFQKPFYPQQAHKKINLQTMMENMLLAQQMQDEYIKQLASKVIVLTTYNKMLNAQISQWATSSSTPLGKFPSKNKVSPRGKCNAMILKEDKQLEGPKRVDQNEHSRYGKDEVVEKEVPTSSNEVIGDDTSNKIPDGPKKISPKPYAPPLRFPQ